MSTLPPVNEADTSTPPIFFAFSVFTSSESDSAAYISFGHFSLTRPPALFPKTDSARHASATAKENRY